MKFTLSVLVLSMAISGVLLAECPQAKSKGSMSKAMNCGKKLSEQMKGVCAKKVTAAFTDSVKSKCLEVHVMPCIPKELTPMIDECIYKVGALDGQNMCDKAIQDKVSECAKKILNDNEKKQQLLKMFKKNMGTVCEQCNKFQACFEGEMKNL